MDLVAIAAGLMKLVNYVLGLVDREQVMKAGDNRTIVRNMEIIHAETEKARASVAAIRTDPRWAERLRKLADRDG